MRYCFILTLSAILVALDQGTKWLALRHIRPDEVLAQTSFFNLVNVRNYGAAFGFLNDPTTNWQFWFFLAATLLATVIILFIAKTAKSTERVLFVALGCILGGAFGNLIDRLRFRYVVDFLDFHWNNLHWPAFNMADAFISTGAALTILLILRGSRSGVA